VGQHRRRRTRRRAGLRRRYPDLETLAAADILRRVLPDLQVRVMNVVDIMRLLPETEHPHGLFDHEFDALFIADKPVISAYHGYRWLIHLPSHQPRSHPRAGVLGAWHHHHTVRHGDAQRPWTASIS
jgi:phosphoketolase